MFQLQPLCQYLLDLILQDAKCLSLLPSLKATAAICLARHIVLEASISDQERDDAAMTPELRFYSGYVEAQLAAAMERFAQLLVRAKTAKLKVLTRRRHCGRGTGGGASRTLLCH